MSSEAGRPQADGVGRALVGALRESFGADLAEGLIRGGGLSRPARALVAISYVVGAAPLVLLVTAGYWRSTVDLTALGATGTGDVSFVPGALVPWLVAAIVVGMALVLTGALHAWWPVRLGALGAYLCVWGYHRGFGDSIAALAPSSSLGLRIAGWCAFAAVPAVFLARWRARPRPAPEFAALAVAVWGVVAVEQASLRADDLRWAGGLAPMQAQTLVVTVATIVAPLLVAAGLWVAMLARRGARWVASSVPASAPLGLMVAGLCAVLAWRVRDVVRAVDARADADGLGAVAWAHLGAAGLVAAVAGGAWLAERARPPRSDDEVADGAWAAAPAVCTASLGAVLAGTAALLADGFVSTGLGPWHTSGLSFGEALADWVAEPGVARAWALLAGVGLVTAAGLWRVVRPDAAPFVAAAGVGLAWSALTDPGGPADGLALDGFAELDLLIVAGTVAWTVARVARPGPEGDVEAVRTAIWLVLVAGFVRQLDIVMAPVAAPLSADGDWALAAGLGWGLLTTGSWANNPSDRLGREARAFLNLGFLVLVDTVVAWFALSRDVEGLGLVVDDSYTRGFVELGIPLVVLGAVRVWRGAGPALAPAGFATAGFGPTGTPG